MGFMLHTDMMFGGAVEETLPIYTGIVVDGMNLDLEINYLRGPRCPLPLPLGAPLPLRLYAC